MAKIDNPYWNSVRSIPGNKIDLEYRKKWHPDWASGESGREALCCKYAWAIPDQPALLFVAKHLAPKAIEIGAGTGYWASLLARMGVDMLCYDLHPPQLTGQNHWHSPRNASDRELLGITREVFFDVQEGNPAVVSEYPDHTLFLCWPPYEDAMASQCLQSYHGKKLVYIGEAEGGCTGDEQFFALLAQEWNQIDVHELVQWHGINDVVEVYERKEPLYDSTEDSDE